MDDSRISARTFSPAIIPKKLVLLLLLYPPLAPPPFPSSGVYSLGGRIKKQDPNGFCSPDLLIYFPSRKIKLKLASRLLSKLYCNEIEPSVSRHIGAISEA